MTFKHFLAIIFSIIILLGATATPHGSERDYEATATRAARFFHYQEWASAGALYTLMLAERPDVVDTYGHAIVAAGMLADTTKQADLTALAIESHIAFDSLFTSVEETSFSVGQTSLYEQYLLYTKRHTPWLSRIIDSYLIRYYTFRRNPHGMIEYSKIILEGNPKNLQFLYTLAQGYLLNNQPEEAINVYNHILTIDASSLEALLYLANYNMSLAESNPQAIDKAIRYFTKAQQIAPSPQIDASLARLNDLKRIYN